MCVTFRRHIYKWNTDSVCYHHTAAVPESVPNFPCLYTKNQQQKPILLHAARKEAKRITGVHNLEENDTVSAPLTSLNEPNTNKQTLKEEKCSSLLSNGAATLPTDSREGIRRFLPPSGNRKEDGPSKRHTNTSVNVLYILIAPVYRTKQSRDLPSQLKRKTFPT